MKSELFLYNKLFLPELCYMSLLCLRAAVSITLLSGKIGEREVHSHSSLKFQSIQTIYTVKNVSLHQQNAVRDKSKSSISPSSQEEELLLFRWYC